MPSNPEPPGGGAFDAEDYAKASTLAPRVAAALTQAKAVADAMMVGKNPQPVGSVPGANVQERSAISMLIQQLWNETSDRQYAAFNVVDGVAHGLAVILAQQDPERAQAFMQLLVANTSGYELRTRTAIELGVFEGPVGHG